MLNIVVLTGRMTANPEIAKTKSGMSACSFSIAVERNFLDKDKERGVDFINIVSFGKTAEFISKYFEKGKLISVDGRLQVRPFKDKDGNKRTAYEVVANSVYFAESKQKQEPEPDEKYPF